MGSYINFVKKERPKITREFPNMSFAEIGKELGRRWRMLTVNTKERYKDPNYSEEYSDNTSDQAASQEESETSQSETSHDSSRASDST